MAASGLGGPGWPGAELALAGGHCWVGGWTPWPSRAFPASKGFCDDSRTSVPPHTLLWPMVLSPCHIPGVHNGVALLLAGQGWLWLAHVGAASVPGPRV